MNVNTMSDEQVHVRIKRSVWERIRELANSQDVSGTKMLEEVLDGGLEVGIGPKLAKELEHLQDFCARHDAELKEFFKYDDEDSYGWLKDFLVRTLSEIEHTDSEDDQDDQVDEDDQDEAYDDDD